MGYNTTVGMLALAGALALPLGVFTANHREAPITALDEKADTTDVYAFVSYRPIGSPDGTASRVTLAMSVDPLLEPANGPTLFPFDPGIFYTLTELARVRAPLGLR